MRKLVIMADPNNTHSWIRSVWFQGYAVEYFNPKRKYGSDVSFYYDMYGPYQDRIAVQLARGHKIIYDANSEHYLNAVNQGPLFDLFCAHPGQVLILISGVAGKNIPGVKISALPYWYWIREQKTFTNLGYHRYIPQPRHEHKFFMPINLARFERDQLYSLMQPVLPQSLHSYRGQGIFMPGDSALDNWQRYINWSWIDACSITVTVETFLEDSNTGGGFSITEHDNRFLSEKTYKPLAYGHAFLLASTQGNLAHVREQGFETFPELWDESYDLLPDHQDRIRAIVKILQDFDPGSVDNSLTQQKIAHNRNRFFNREITARLMREMIVDPVLAFLYE